jgi:hypothetical protein
MLASLLLRLLLRFFSVCFPVCFSVCSSVCFSVWLSVRFSVWCSVCSFACFLACFSVCSAVCFSVLPSCLLPCFLFRSFFCLLVFLLAWPSCVEEQCSREISTVQPGPLAKRHSTLSLRKENRSQVSAATFGAGRSGKHWQQKSVARTGASTHTYVCKRKDSIVTCSKHVRQISVAILKKHGFFDRFFLNMHVS